MVSFSCRNFIGDDLEAPGDLEAGRHAESRDEGRNHLPYTDDLLVWKVGEIPLNWDSPNEVWFGLKVFIKTVIHGWGSEKNKI